MRNRGRPPNIISVIFLAWFFVTDDVYFRYIFVFSFRRGGKWNVIKGKHRNCTNYASEVVSWKVGDEPVVLYVSARKLPIFLKIRPAVEFLTFPSRLRRKLLTPPRPTHLHASNKFNCSKRETFFEIMDTLGFSTIHQAHRRCCSSETRVSEKLWIVRQNTKSFHCYPLLQTSSSWLVFWSNLYHKTTKNSHPLSCLT